MMKTEETRNDDTRALHQSVKDGHVQEARALLERGVKADAVTKDSFAEETPLCHAASCGNIEMMRLLLSYGADPNAMIYDGTNVFDYALVPKNAREVIALLFAGGLSVEARDSIGVSLSGVNPKASGRARRFAEHNSYRESVAYMEKQLNLHRGIWKRDMRSRG